MNARESFYSSVFEKINSYKNKSQNHAISSGLFADHFAEYGIFAAGLLISVFSGLAFIFPNYMKFERPFYEVGSSQINITSADESYAAVPVSVPINVQVAPNADTYVSTASANKNFGDQNILRVQANPASQALLSFDLAQTQEFNRAYLILPARSESASVDVFVSNSYRFDEMTFTNADLPSSGFELISMIDDTTFPARIDVSSYVSDTEVLSVLLRSRSGTVVYDSREAASEDVPMLSLE